MTLAQKLKHWLTGYYEDDPMPPRPEPVAEETPIEPVKHSGKVIRGIKAPTFEPEIFGTGGHVIKAMPRELRKIKEAQERTDDE